MTKTAAERYQDFYNYVTGLQGWTIRAVENWGIVGERRWKYPSGHQVALWADYVSSGSVGHVEAHVSYPMSAGPEVSTRGKSPEEIDGWVKMMTVAFDAPLRVAEAPTYDEALRIIDKLKGLQLNVVALAFDVNPLGRSASIRQEIIGQCANPKVRHLARTFMPRNYYSEGE